MDSIFVSQTKGRGFDSPWGYCTERLVMAKTHKIKTVRMVKGNRKEEKFNCDANELDNIIARESNNPNTLSVWVDGNRVYP
jgi:hypothetical protein